MDKRTKEIARNLKAAISKKYAILDFRVFGSRARGEEQTHSDIDIFVHLEKTSRQIEEDIFDMSYGLELEHDCLIDVIVTAEITPIPLYEHILSEGVGV